MQFSPFKIIKQTKNKKIKNWKHYWGQASL